MSAIASGRGAVGSESAGSDPMEVDSVSVKKKPFKFKKELKSEKKSTGNAKRVTVDLDRIPASALGRLMKEKRCLRCGEEGHRYSQCPNPEKDFGQE